MRIELATALQRKRVIPVLIDDVPMPRAEELPEELTALVRCQATRLSHDRFRADSDRLIRALKQVLANAEAPSPALDAMNGSQEGPLTPTPTSTGAKTEKLSFKAVWERFRAHVRIPHWQRLLSKKAIIIGGVSVVLLISLLLLIPHGQRPIFTDIRGPVPAPLSKGGVPDWVPVYPFADQENVFLRRGAGSLSFETENGAQHVSEAYAAKLKAAGWNVRTRYYGGALYSAAGTSPEQQHSVGVAADSAEGKTHVAVSFLDNSVVQREESFSPETIPSWIPVYPGKVENLRYKGNSGGFSISTTDSARQVSALYEAILGSSGYEVAASYLGGAQYNVRGTVKSQRSIAVSTDKDNEVTKILVLFEQQQKHASP